MTIFIFCGTCPLPGKCDPVRVSPTSGSGQACTGWPAISENGFPPRKGVMTVKRTRFASVELRTNDELERFKPTSSPCRGSENNGQELQEGWGSQVLGVSFDQQRGYTFVCCLRIFFEKNSIFNIQHSFSSYHWILPSLRH